jgi:hypothetical protein
MSSRLVGGVAVVDLTSRWVHRGEDPSYLVLHQISKTFAATCASGNGGHDPASSSDADIGGKQQLLKRFNGIDVYLCGAGHLRVSATNDLVESIDDLLLGATQAVAQAVK